MYTPFKMKGKSPMMKALIGKQGNLPAELQAKIKASPATMKKESSMKMMKKSPAKVSIFGKKEPDTSGLDVKKKSTNKGPVSFGQAFKENKKAGKKIFTWKGKKYNTTTKSEVAAKNKKTDDPLTKNIMNTNQKGDEDLKATVKNKEKGATLKGKKIKTNVNGKETKSKVVNKNKKGKVNVFSAKYKSMTRSQRAKFYGADYKTRKQGYTLDQVNINLKPKQ